jgi:hypothetical protein
MDRGNRGRSQMLTLVIGVLLSTVLGVFFYFRTDLNTAIATFAGLTGTTITLQVESLLQEREIREQTTRQQRLVHRIESTIWMPELLDDAVSAFAVIEQTYGATMAVELARKAFDDCRTRLGELQRGRYITSDADESPNSPALPLTERLRDSLLATSSGDDISWWLDASTSRNYWRLNIEALQRGVMIERIFIYRQWTDELDAVAKAQHASGVRVLRVLEDQLPATLRLNLVIWDELCGLEPQHNSAGEWIGSSFTFAAQDLALLLDRFKMIEHFAEQWPTVSASQLK